MSKDVEVVDFFDIVLWIFEVFMLVRWSSRRDCCDFMIRLKNSSFWTIEFSDPGFCCCLCDSFSSSKFSSCPFSEGFSFCSLPELDRRLMEQRWSSSRFDWIFERTSKNEASSSLPSDVLVEWNRSLLDNDCSADLWLSDSDWFLLFAWLALLSSGWSGRSIAVCV